MLDVPHRVILAACESGNDVSFEGNEMLGFVSTLMARGTAGVLASSVVVPDQDLLSLMTALHTAIGEGSDARARAAHSSCGDRLRRSDAVRRHLRFQRIRRRITIGRSAATAA